ncbi:MAG: methyltransferase domain-containing protein [Planctomycetota bacterium]
MTEPAEYVLGTNDSELDRLRFQAGVWSDMAEAALDRAGVTAGMTVLDLGCGPGFVTEALARRVGPTGHVVALDESPRWHAAMEERTFAAPVERVESTVEEADLGEARFDAVFSRWVFSFLGDAAALEAVCRQVHRALKPGGRLIVQDYNHEGISIFPPSRGFEAVVRATRDFYAGAGGDAWVMGTLPGAARRAGLNLVEFTPTVRSGGPSSDVFRWADVFFPKFSTTFVEQGLMTQEEQTLFLEEWSARKANPDALFFSPIVADLIVERAECGAVGC